MKTGATVDEDGEIIDYNKVDTALKSIGISLKDAQYQFRDFDDVIFELSEKWDSLDKNTQRYIATIMAGNRQQSRFIALVDNWERLDEVAAAAQNSEDAGLLQYSKTLDSLETKLNNIKTSFQEFYMSIINGPVISKALETINSLFEGFNKQGPFAALLDVGSIVSSLTIIGNMFVSIFSGAFGQISANWKAMLQGLPTDAAVAGQKAGDQYRNGATQPRGIGKLGTGLATAASFTGLALTTAGAAVTQKYHNNVGAGMSAVGNALSYGSMGFMLSGGNPIVTIVAGALGGITSAVSSWRSDLELEQAKLEEATEKAEKSNIIRAEKKTEYETLKREISNLEELEKARFDSAEAQQEWINANNALFEQFPYLAATFDEVGNATIDLEAAEQALAIARKASLQATIKAAEDEKNRAQQDLNVAKVKQKEKYDKIATGQKFKLESGKTYKAPALISGAGAYPADFERWLLSPKRSEQVELLKQTGVLSEKVAKSGKVSYKLSNDSNIFSTFLFYFLDQLNAEKHSEWLATFEGLTQEETLSKLISEGASKFTNSEGNQIYKTTQDFLAAWLNHGAAFTSLNEQQQEYIEYIIATINSSTQEIEDLENQITGADKTLLASKTAEQLHLKEEQDDKDYDETYGKIAGWDNYVARYVKEAQAAVEEPFDDERIGKEVEAAVDQWDALEDKLKQSSKLEDYNSLVESFEKGNISIVDYINSLEDLFNEIIPDAVQNTQEWAKAEVNKNIKNLAQGLVNKAGWSKGGREDWEAETDTLSNTEEWLQSIPKNLHQNIVDYVNYVNELVTKAKIEDSQADSMVEVYTGLYDAINEAGFTPEKKAEAFALLDTADLTSLGGIYEYQNALKKAGIEFDSESQVWNNLIQQVLVNIVTETQTFQQKLASALDADVKLLKQAYDGVDSVVEATELASKLGVTLADFETSGGKIRLKKDTDLKAKREEELAAYKKDLYGEGESWTSGDSAYAKEYRRALEEGSNVESEFYKKYQFEFEKWQKLPENSNKSLADYIKARRDSELAAINSLFTKFWEEQEKLIKKQSIVDSIYGGEARRKKLSAQQSLASGGQGLSGDTIYDILNAYGYDPEKDWQDYFTKNADGTFDIITNSGLFNQLDQATQNAIIDKVAANVDSAEQGLLKLGESAATGKKLDASEIRNLLGAEFDGLSDNTANLLYKQYQLYLQGGVTEGTLIANFAKAIREDDPNKNWETALSEAKEIYSNIQAQLTDAVKTNLSKQLELQAKVLQGTATETEKEALKDAGINISGLERKTNKAIVNWINSYLKNTDISFDDKIKYTKTAFSTALTNEFGEDIGTLGETAVKGVFGTQDAAADFISKYYALIGKEIDENQADDLVSDWFTRDASGQYKLAKTIEKLQDELTAARNSSNAEMVDNLNAQLTYYEKLQTIQRKEGLISSLQSLTAAESITASQMMSLFEDQGKSLSAEDAEDYAQILESLNPIERLKQLKTYLSSAGIKIDTEEYADLAKGIITSTMQSAQSSISKLSSGMSWNDAFGLTKEIDGLSMADFKIIDNQYFIQNTEQIAQFWKEQITAAFSEQKDALATMGENLGEVPIAVLENGLDAFGDSEIPDLSGKYANILELMNSEYFDESHYQQWLSQAGNASKNFGQYWQDYLDSLDDAAHAAIDAWQEEADRQLAIANRAAELKQEAKTTKGEKFLDQVEAKELIKSRGLSGYSPEDIAKLEAAGYLAAGQTTLQDDGTYTIPKDILTAVNDISVGNAINIKLTSEVESAKTAADNLAKNLLSGTATLEDYTALFGDKYTGDVGEALAHYLAGSAQIEDENLLKQALLKVEGRTEADVAALLSQLGISYADYKHELARSIFDTKIEALSSGYLSETSKETLKKGGASDFVTKFADLAGKAADKIFDTVYKEYEKAYDDGVIKRDEYRTGIAEAASKAFTAKVEVKKPSLYLDDATKEIAGGDALYDADALGSLYAAIADKQKAVKKSVLTFDEFYNEYVNGITEAGEAILDVKALNEKGYVSDRRYKEFSSTLVENLFSSAENIITQFKTGDTTGLDLQIQQMFDSLGMALSSEDAAAIVEGGEQVLLNRLIFEIGRAGLDTTEVQSRLEELQVLILDTITESISSGMSALGEGIKGTLSEASFLDLQKRYGFKDSSFRTSRGVQLSAQNLQDVIIGLYGDAKANSRTAGFGEQLLEVLNIEGSGFEGYKDIEEAIADANKQIAEGVKDAKEYAEALILARDAAYEMADATEFAFMEQDGYDGKADTFDKFTENVIKAKEALGAFKKGGKVAHADLTAMFDVIKSSDSGIKAFNDALAGTNLKIDDMLNTALRLNKLGEIDIGEITAKWGIDIETATSAMTEGMSASLQATAKDQIKYLSGLEAMLMAMVAMEELGSTKLGLEIDITGDGKADVIYLKDVHEAWMALQKAPKEKQMELVTNIKTLFNNSESTSAFLKEFGISNQDAFSLFFPDGLDFNNEQAFKDIDLLGQIFDNISGLSPEQASAVSKGMFSILEESLTYNAETQKWSFGQGWQKSMLEYVQTLDWSNIPSLVDTQVSEWLSSQNNKISFKIGEIEITATENGFIIPPGSNLEPEAVSTFLKEKLGIADGGVIQTKTDAGIQISFTGQPQLKTESEDLKIEFQSLEEAATKVAEQTNLLQQTIATFEVSEGFREFVGLLNQITGGTQVAMETAEGAAQLANLGKEINAEGEGNGLQLKVDISEAITAFDELKTQFATLIEVLSTPITIDIKSVGTITAGAPAVESQSSSTPGEGTGAGVNTITTHTVQILWEVPQPDFDSIEEPIIGFEWKKPAPPVPAPAKTPTISFYWASNSTTPKYTGKPVEIPTILKKPSIGNTNSEIQQVAMVWTGTMNDISGTAFADGSIDRLYSGAQLAGKTLVGELGPELAVYDGQYHLLGQHGAEFVNLPGDAIVFNHKQTEGIANGQFNIRGKAMADGNITGPAMAGGAAAALEAVRRAKSLWQGLLDDLTAAQLAGGGAGGGGGNTLKGVKEELQEWYNLSRQIADIEQEINNLVAERQNIAEKNGDAYLRSLRKEQELLEQQAATQKILLGYQQLQLDRQAEQINTNKIWSQFLEVDESGLLQYIKGNELNGGKGALEVLSELNEMSGEEQLKFLNNLGYTAVDQDGEKLEGQELIQKFFEELQLQIDEYDALYDTVHETEETLEDLQHKVQEINDQIIENQMDLEQDIFDILVDAWEEEIDALEEQKDLVEEANDAYIKGLNEALSAEREMYSEEQSIADREQLQRQLSLLRRSGGSASQIADLEQQLDSMLKDEYFRNQEQVIERIEDANEEQIRQLQRQIRLQEEALEFEKENGILWTKVYDIMSGSADQILNFMQGNSPEFFSQSLLQQEKMLTEWAKKIGIYTENKKYEGYEQDIQQSAWDSGDIWSYDAMSDYKNTYDSMTSEQQAAARNMFNTTYANARLAGDDHNAAIAKAQNALINNFKSYKEQQAASSNKPETDLYTGSGSQILYVTGPNKLNLRDQPSKSGNRLAQLSAGTKVKVIKKLDNGWFQVEVNGKTGYVDSQFLSKETSSSSSGNSNNSQSSNSSSSSSGKQYKANYTITYQNKSTGEVKTYTGTGIGNTEAAAIKTANEWLKRRRNGERPSAFPSSEWDEMASRAATKAYAYAQGGLVNYTGIAMVHGSSSKPEAFLNAKQTAMISEAVKVAGDGGALDGIRTTLNKLDATIKSIINNNKNETTSFTVAPGAVTIQVAQLNDSYDVEELSKDVMNRMVAIASKSTNRGVNRR